MRFGAVVLLIVAFGVASCDDSDGPSSPGTLIVSTSTSGNYPDRDGYVLTVDGARSLTLDPTDSIETGLPAGRHDLRLLGVAEHCSVEPDLSLEIMIEASTATPVAFDIGCQATGAVVSAVTSGVDLDPDGFRMVVDGVDRGAVVPNATALVLLGPGSRTIVLQGLAGNCAMDGPASHTVTVTEAEVVPVEFALTCRATAGVIGVSLADGEVEGLHQARVDGGAPLGVVPGAPAYFDRVTPGDHVVSLSSPQHCVVEEDELTVTVAGGGVARDTAEVVFTVHCEPTIFRITSPTSGLAGDAVYTVWACNFSNYYCYYYGPSFLGSLPPNGTLLAPIAPEGSYSLELRDVPVDCHVRVPNPVTPPTPEPGDTVDVEFPVSCSP